MLKIIPLFNGLEEENANILTDVQLTDSITGSTPMRSALYRISKA
jgi:hypothetical protein